HMNALPRVLIRQRTTASIVFINYLYYSNVKRIIIFLIQWCAKKNKLFFERRSTGVTCPIYTNKYANESLTIAPSSSVKSFPYFNKNYILLNIKMTSSKQETQ